MISGLFNRCNTLCFRYQGKSDLRILLLDLTNSSVCIHSLWLLLCQSSQSPAVGHHQTSSHHILKVKFASSFLLPNDHPGVTLFFCLFVWTHIVRNSKQSRQLLLLERHDSLVLHLASRINSCSGLIVSRQQGLKATYFVYSVSNTTLSPVDIYCAFNDSFVAAFCEREPALAAQ